MTVAHHGLLLIAGPKKCRLRDSDAVLAETEIENKETSRNESASGG
jgi:hypothetical protein